MRIIRLLGVVLCLVFLSGAARAAPNWTVFRDVQYGLTAQEKADLYLLNKGVNPAVVMIHGGGWQAGDKSYFDGYYARLYAMAGFHVVSINYRLASYADRTTQWNAQLQDVQLAMRWLRQYAGILRIDPTRIGVVGSSAGAHLALFLGSLATNVAGDRSPYLPLQSPKASAVVDMFGPVDLTRPDMSPQIAPLALFGARSYAQAPSLYRNASPIFYLNARTAPTCVVHGTTDVTVPLTQSQLLITRLFQLAAPFQFFPYNGGHMFAGLTSWQQSLIDNAALRCVSGYLHPNPANAL